MDEVDEFLSLCAFRTMWTGCGMMIFGEHFVRICDLHTGEDVLTSSMCTLSSEEGESSLRIGGGHGDAPQISPLSP